MSEDDRGPPLLTKDDFIMRTKDIYFACQKCGFQTKDIVRDGRRKYLAIFHCDNVRCTSVNRWIKCRVCTIAHDIDISQFSKHVRQKKHLKRVAEFEGSKPPAYAEYESRFVEPITLPNCVPKIEETDKSGHDPLEHLKKDNDDE